MLEQPKKELYPRKIFLFRLLKSLGIGLILSAAALFIGMWGYHHYEKLSWLDSYLNAAMILSGMGPIWNPQTEAGKIFCGSYAIFSGLFFIILLGLVLGPVIHRILHKFHLEDEERRQKQIPK